MAFIKRFNEVVHGRHPGVLTIAEESTAWPAVSHPTYLGGLGFSMKWNMGWMNDILRYFSQDPVFRKFHQNHLTFALLYAFTENFVLVLSHDEVVYGKRSLLDKMPGDLWQKFANLRLLYSYMYAQPGKKLLFMGGEIGQWWEWNANTSLDWHLIQYEPHRRLLAFVKDLNMLYREEPSMHEVDFHHEGFEWIDFSDYERSVVSFIRRAKNREDFLVFVFNLTPVPRYNYRIGVPRSRVLPGDTQQRLRNLLGKQHRKSGRTPCGARSMARPPFVTRPRPAAPRRYRTQAGVRLLLIRRGVSIRPTRRARNARPRMALSHLPIEGLDNLRPDELYWNCRLNH